MRVPPRAQHHGVVQVHSRGQHSGHLQGRHLRLPMERRCVTVAPSALPQLTSFASRRPDRYHAFSKLGPRCLLCLNACTCAGDLRKLANDPDNLVLDSKLRRDVLTCGELAQACYDSCEKEASSYRRCWNIFADKPEKIQDVRRPEHMI